MTPSETADFSSAYLLRDRANDLHFWALCHENFRAICLTSFQGFPPFNTLNLCVDSEQWVATPPDSQQGFIILQHGKVILAQTDDSELATRLEPQLVLLRSLHKSTLLPHHDVLPLITMLRPIGSDIAN